ncbi:unnamed protein product [Acanthoscelides obtectus]|uniref:Uncharacterized protein n=1 Tax=Acanthoscelides obtectus TaxID=200917 RepID=A0A9P0PI24_ACAOB|nr:unnamed protein product [Acanthoscelides obtectus]CAK1660699.1 hypothetical protein AOBTE_LOCUS22222 [Acanthoscelides obtectus]
MSPNVFRIQLQNQTDSMLQALTSHTPPRWSYSSFLHPECSIRLDIFRENKLINVMKTILDKYDYNHVFIDST